MKALVLIPWALTDWSASGRFTARTSLPLTEAGCAQAQAWGRELAKRELHAIYRSAEQTSRETAEAVAAGAVARVRGLEGIEEVCFGLWEGLTEESLRTRFPKAHRRWKEDPSSVCPPEGEGLAAAAERLHMALRTVLRKAERANVGVVLGPVACALVRCDLEQEPLNRVRDMAIRGPFEYPDVERVLQPAAPRDGH